MRIIVLLICMLGGISAFSQISLSRQVIGSTGGSTVMNDSLVISTTVGESVISTLSSGVLTLTQGFQQPGFAGFLNFKIETTQTSCPTSTDGTARITDLVGCRPPYTILWSNGSKTTSAEDLGTGFHSVTIATSECAITKTFEITVSPEVDCDLHFFNAFSPNADGYNDTWEIENIENQQYRDNKVEIFNRWGQRVWEGANYDNTNVVWKGAGHNGNTLPSATYYYIATVNGKVYKGYIELTK